MTLAQFVASLLYVASFELPRRALLRQLRGIG